MEKEDVLFGLSASGGIPALAILVLGRHNPQ